jgi:hypothetical protein
MTELIKCEAVQAALDACASDDFDANMKETENDKLKIMIEAEGSHHIVSVNKEGGRVKSVSVNYAPRY